MQYLSSSGGVPRLYVRSYALFHHRILSGHPAHAGIDHDGVPAVLGGGHPFERSAVLHGSNAVVLCAIARADVHRAAAADDAHTLRRGSVRRIGLRGLFRLFGFIRLIRFVRLFRLLASAMETDEMEGVTDAGTVS